MLRGANEIGKTKQPEDKTDLNKMRHNESMLDVQVKRGKQQSLLCCTGRFASI